MAEIKSIYAKSFRDGDVIQNWCSPDAYISLIVGYRYANYNWVLCIKFDLPVAARSVTMSFCNAYSQEFQPAFRYKWTDQEEEYLQNATSDTPGDGVFTLTNISRYGRSTVVFDRVLLAGTHYLYIWTNDSSVLSNYNVTNWCEEEYGFFATYEGSPRSLISGCDGTLGQKNVLELTRYSERLTHDITAVCGGESMQIATGTQSDTVAWTPPLEWAGQNLTGAAVSVTVTCTTLGDGVSVGTSTVTLVFQIPEDVIPTVNIVVTDSTGYLDKYGSYIQGKSKAAVQTVSAGIYGSTIQKCVVFCGTLTGTGANLVFDLPSAGAIPITVTVMDSRGRTASCETQIEVAAYTAPSAEIISRYRSDADGNEDPDGTLATVTFNAAVTPLDGQNTAEYVVKYRAAKTENWTSVPMGDLTGTFEVTGAMCCIEVDTNLAYEICVVVTDNFGSVSSSYRTIQVSFALIDADRGNRALGFGQRATIPNALAIGLQTFFAVGAATDFAQAATEADLETWLDMLLSSMADRTMRPVSFYCPALTGAVFGGTLFRSTSQYATLFGFDPGNNLGIKSLTPAGWSSWVTLHTGSNEGIFAIDDSDGNVDVVSGDVTAEDDGSGNVAINGAVRTGETRHLASITFPDLSYTYKVEGITEHKQLSGRDLADQHPIEAITGLQTALNTKFDDVEVTSDGYLYLLCNGERVSGPHGPFAGSGAGGSQNNATITMQNTTGWLYKSIAQNGTCKVSFSWTSTEDGVSTGMGAVTVKVGGVLRYSASVAQGDVDLDIGSYLSSGSNAVRVSVSDIYGNSRTLAYTINVVTLQMKSTFDPTVAFGGAINYVYTPVGAVEKTLHFILDGVEIGTCVTSESNRQQTFVIPAQAHGSHTFLAYFTAEIDGETVPSNGLYYDLICTESGNTTPIIVSSFRGTAAEQYIPITIPWIVHNPANLTTAVTLKANGEVVSEQTVDRTEQLWTYRPDDAGELTLAIQCGDTVKPFVINVAKTTMDVVATTADLSLHLTAYGRSNNEAEPGVWSYRDVSAQLTGFNFKSDGWQPDEDGNTVLRISGDARVYIPLQIFASDFRTTGKTIEVEFATRDVLNYDAVLLTCMSGGIGMEINAQRACLSSEQSTIGTQYKEEEHIRLSFVVEKRSENKLLLCYINGILSGSVQYPDSDDFSQAVPVGITIGSSECTTDIYCIRMYDNDLTRFQILDNWIADTQNGVLRKERYDRNEIFDAYGQIVIENLPKDLPYLVLECAALPQFKGDKKTCSGYYVDPLHPERSFRFENAEIDVQGTSSQYYYVKNYKIKFKGGFILTDGTTVEVYQMNDDAVPTNVFTYKADVASSEGANNVVLAQLYNELCPILTPPQEEDPRVRQAIDGHPIVVFWDNGSGAEFLGKYNFNNDKGTEEVFGFADGDESWEILQNGTDRVGFHSADFSGSDWKNDFEARYPEDNVDTSNLAAFATWIASTDTAQATDAALSAPVTYGGVEYVTDTAEYRLAKFTAELADHANVDALVFYYVITDLFLCIDQREKNAFPTRFDDMGKWIMFFYDADSSLGIDNKGNLAFDYWLENIDYTEAGDPVFNGQNSVLWVNLRSGFYAKITAEYQRLRTELRSDGSGNPLLSYNVVNGLFEAHQSKWSEAIYNEDMNKKCIDPLEELGDGLYLPMLQGKKEQQRKRWLYNRFRYKDSQFVTGTSMSTRITIRAHAKANITLTSYVNMYGHVYYNAAMVEHRMMRGQEYEFVWPASGAEDPVIGINDADMLTSLGDLSPLMVELIDISKATHLTVLKVGDAAEGYVNNNLNSVTLGNNYLLRRIDLRNCAKLAQAVDASGCTGLQEAYFDGTAITGVSLPNGGSVKVLHLPSTVSNITIRNQAAIEDFTCPGFANVATLWLENVSAAVDPLLILSQMKAGGRVRLTGIDWTLNDAGIMDKLLTMRGLNEAGDNVDTAVLSGSVHFAMDLPVSTRMTYEEAFPYLTITADSYDLDVLAVSSGLVLVTADNKLFRLSDGGYTTARTGEELDEYVTERLDAQEVE